MRTYAGTGSVAAPAEILALLTRVAAALFCAGWTLRSTHAPGIEQALEQGCHRHVELFLAWPQFGGNAVLPCPGPRRWIPSLACSQLAPRLVPGWRRYSTEQQAMLGAVLHALLGDQLDEPARFLLVWTGGQETLTVKLARRLGVPVRDLARPEVMAGMEAWAALPLSDAAPAAASPG